MTEKENALRAKGQYGGFHDLQDNDKVADSVKEALKHGTTRVWYKKENAGALFFDNPDPDHMQATHTLLASVASTEPDILFWCLQGENWSPNGEANGIVGKDKLHTSMSVGDCLAIDGVIHICQSMGWEVLS